MSSIFLALLEAGPAGEPGECSGDPAVGLSSSSQTASDSLKDVPESAFRSLETAAQPHCVH